MINFIFCYENFKFFLPVILVFAFAFGYGQKVILINENKPVNNLDTLKYSGDSDKVKDLIFYVKNNTDTTNRYKAVKKVISSADGHHNNWVDEYSQRYFDTLQAYYCYFQGISSPYTPQFVLNGEASVENDEQFNSYVNTAFSAAPVRGIALAPVSMEENRLIVEYDIAGSFSGTTLVLILHECSLINEVTSGENKGKTLKHDNVVRVYKRIPVSEKHGTAMITIPGDAVLENCAAAAYLRNSANFEILAATKGFTIDKISSSEKNIASEAPALEIFPNPAREHFFISLQEEFYVNYSIEIINSIGKTVFAQKIDGRQPFYEIEAAEFDKGVYFVRIVINGKKTLCRKLIKI